MTVTIREGRTYVARNGEKFGPMRRAKDHEFNSEWPWTVDGREAWKTNGSYSTVRPVCDLDLIAEWTEGPVRTVTRTVTEIVEGQYGILEVGKATTMPTQCGSDEESPVVYVSIVTAYSTASELRAAAAVLLQLAGALTPEEN